VNLKTGEMYLYTLPIKETYKGQDGGDTLGSLKALQYIMLITNKLCSSVF